MQANTTSHRIQLLPPELKNQIAAGEVVERPASALKELLENSLDAGADRIAVRIEHGGQGLLEILDNGCGLAADELELAVTRHATSKVRTFEELMRVNSFGFRGEALAAIASVSRFTLASNPGHEDGGFAIDVIHGAPRAIKPAALPRGSRVTVRDLFANVPARLKFLKTTATETRRCVDVFIRTALARPHVHFTLTSGDRELVRFLPKQSLRERITTIWPPAIVDPMIHIHDSNGPYRVHGMLGHPKAAQSRPDRIFLYVNGRPVQDKLMLKALRDAYSGRLLAREHPQAILFLDLPENEVDVNVHPAKAEVRFSDERAVFLAIRRAVSKPLDNNAASAVAAMQPQATHPQEPLPPELRTHQATFKESSSGYGETASGAPASSEPQQNRNKLASVSTIQPNRNSHDALSSTRYDNLQYEMMQPSAVNHAVDTQTTLPLTPPTSIHFPQSSQNFSQHAGLQAQAPLEAPPFLADDPSTARPSFQYEYLSQLGDTYLLLKLDDGGLAILDQHAAHERILYESFQNERRDASRPLATPMFMPLHATERERLMELAPELARLGFESATTPNGLEVHAVPGGLTPAKAKEFIKACLSERLDDLSTVWAQLACRLALKAGESLAKSEALALVEAWSACPGRDYCPHGRPALIRITLGELAKRFKRSG